MAHFDDRQALLVGTSCPFGANLPATDAGGLASADMETLTNDPRRLPRYLTIAYTMAALALFAGGHHALAAGADAAAPPLKAPIAGKYKLDKAHASLLFRVSHLGFSTYTTRFSRFDADLTFDPANLAASSVVTVIDAGSLEMPDAPRECVDIVRGPQMLGIAQFPQIVFRSERIHVNGKNAMDISGSLTIHGVTRPVVLKATFNGGYAGMQMDPQSRIGFSAHGSFKRSDFGVGYGVPAPGSNFGVGDSIEITIEAEFSGPALVASAGPQR